MTAWLCRRGLHLPVWRPLDMLGADWLLLRVCAWCNRRCPKRADRA